jgi:hypothetical protein
MVYGNHKVRMTNKKTAPAAAEAGNDSFRKAGPEFVRLREIMESKGALFNNVTATTVCAEEPWFLTFKPNSLKANITALKREFNERGNIEGLRKFLLIIRFDLTNFTKGAIGLPKDDEDADAEPKIEVTEETQKIIAAAAASCKRPPPTVVVPLSASAKKQAVEQPKNVVTGVVTQAVSLDSKSVERVACVVTMPGNITNKSQISVEFAAGSNGAKINVYVPRGKVANNMDRLKKGIALMSGLDLMDAAHITRSLETKLMSRRENIDELIVDVISITLDKACDPQKKALVTVFKAPDGDTVAVLLMEVPSKKDYGKRDKDNGDAIMLADEDDY